MHVIIWTGRIQPLHPRRRRCSRSQLSNKREQTYIPLLASVKIFLHWKVAQSHTLKKKKKKEGSEMTTSLRIPLRKNSLKSERPWPFPYEHTWQKQWQGSGLICWWEQEAYLFPTLSLPQTYDELTRRYIHVRMTENRTLFFCFDEYGKRLRTS